MHVIDTTGPRVNLHPVSAAILASTRLVRILLSVLVQIGHADLVFLSCSAGKSLIMASMIWFLCTMRCRPMALKVFGGDLAEQHARCSLVTRLVAELTFFRCRRVYVQTREIERRLRDRANVRWFPNTRDIGGTSRIPDTARKFLFIAQLRDEKGLREALEACRSLPADCHLSVFGPLMPETDLSLFDHHARATYGGVLAPEIVPTVIQEHDVLLLPSYFNAEGYPGIIIEAMQCARPVISTLWKSIPEVVEDGLSGLLVTPRSSKELRRVLLQVVEDHTLFRTLCHGAKVRGDYFRSGPWYDWMVDDLRSLAGLRGRR